MGRRGSYQPICPPALSQAILVAWEAAGRNGLSAASEAQGQGTLAFASPWQIGHFVSAIWKFLSSFALVDVARAAGASNDCDAFQRGGNDARVRASASAEVCLAPVHRSDDFPCPCVVGESYKVILLDSRSDRSAFAGRGAGHAFLTKRHPPGG